MTTLRRVHSVHQNIGAWNAPYIEPAHKTPPTLHKMAGLTYVEVLVAIAFLAITLLPIMQALQTGLAGAEINAEYTSDHYYLMAKFEEVLAEPFGALDAEATAAGGPTVPTAYSDTVGTQPRRLVYLSRYDADNADADNDFFTGVDDGILWVRAEIEATAHVLETLIDQ